jgi:hypothetical protein
MSNINLLPIPPKEKMAYLRLGVEWTPQLTRDFKLSPKL